MPCQACCGTNALFSLEPTILSAGNLGRCRGHVTQFIAGLKVLEDRASFSGDHLVGGAEEAPSLVSHSVLVRVGGTSFDTEAKPAVPLTILRSRPELAKVNST